jgi:hypothetical protein
MILDLLLAMVAVLLPVAAGEIDARLERAQAATSHHAEEGQ